MSFAVVLFARGCAGAGAVELIIVGANAAVVEFSFAVGTFAVMGLEFFVARDDVDGPGGMGAHFFAESAHEFGGFFFLAHAFAVGGDW